MHDGQNTFFGFRLTFLLLLIVLIGLFLRIAVLVFFSGTIDTEGAEYARIAENLLAGNGYRGIATPGVELMFPPLYPLLIAGLTLIVQDAELAARLICLLFGAGLPVAIFYVAALFYDRRIALLAALVATLHPVLIHLSAATYSEGPFMTVVFFSIYCAFRSMQNEETKWFLATGVLFGSAYLIRPEAFMLPFLAVAFYAIMRAKNIFRNWRRPAVLLAAFFVLAAPYMWFLYKNTGQVRFEGKTPINYEIGLRLLNGQDILKAGYGLGPDLKETGVWLRSNADIFRTAHFSGREIIGFARRAGPKNVQILLKHLFASAWLGSPFLIFLVILGLFGAPWTDKQLPMQLFLMTIFLLTAAGLLTVLHYVGNRYFFFYIPFLLLWSALGAVHFGCWAQLSSHSAIHSSRVSKAIGVIMGVLPVVGLLTLSSFSAGRLPDFKDFGKQSRPEREAGVFLRSLQDQAATIMDSETTIAFHAKATYVPFPSGSAEDVLAYADRKNVDFIVIRSPQLTWRTDLDEVARTGIGQGRLKLVLAPPGQTTHERFLIYRRTHGNSL
jgi:4-amino-4-deoxy-L-arabinose transferase-like glycosyltransferase